MQKKKAWLWGAAAVVIFISGCEALVLGGAAVGTGAGTYYYFNGGLQTEYNASFDKVWTACEKTMADMHALNVLPMKEIGSGTISATINDAKVQFAVKYKAKNFTNVTVRVGLFGDNIGSQLLQDKIGENISKN
ncbi:MAG: DUF3568 domain-containing protein [Syntrophales bacterium LBB04]|nr:DUF3568 domain-containing protein [Syntrophales bacterium LBB04]